jgi:Cys-tRNA(Pro) deacylase
MTPSSREEWEVASKPESYGPVEKVRRSLEKAGYRGKILESEETIFTVEDASRTVGAPPEAILKTIVLQADGSFVLALMSGTNRVDLKAVKRLLAGTRKVSMAHPDEVLAFSGFAVGGVPPVGYSEKLPAFIDEDLFTKDTVWAAAGTDHAFFPVSPEELAALTCGQVASIKKEGKGLSSPLPE